MIRETGRLLLLTIGTMLGFMITYGTIVREARAVEGLLTENSPPTDSAVDANMRRLAKCDRCTTLNANNVDLPNLGKRITLAKIFDFSRSSLTLITADERGIPIDRAETERAERMADRLTRGALSDDLNVWRNSVDPRESKAVQFSYWPTLDYPSKDLLLSDPLVAHDWQEQVARAEQKAQSVMRDCATKGAGEIVGVPSATKMLVRMTAAGLSRIKFACDAEVHDIDVKASSLADYSDAIVNNASAWSSFTGSGVSIGVLEDCAPTKSFLYALTGIPSGGIEPNPFEPNSPCLHQTEVVSVIRADPKSVVHGGVAPTATTLVGTQLDYSLSWATNKGATIINRSYFTGGGDIAMSQLDYAAKLPPYPLIISGAGNEPDVPVANYHMNGLIVGGANSNINQPGNRYSYTSPAGSWKNRPSPHGDRELPDMVASYAYFTLVNGVDTGTSFAAPQVSGAAARLVSSNSVLRSWPEGLRAILQATADQDVDDHSPAGVDRKGGTGLLNVDRALEAAQTEFFESDRYFLSNGHGFALGTLSRDEFPSATYAVIFPPTTTHIGAGRLLPHLRIAVAFDAAPDSSNGGGIDILDADIDLIVRRGTDNNPVQCAYTNENYYSASYDNSYEFVDCHVINPDPASWYTIDVIGSNFNRSVAWYGLAIAKDDYLHYPSFFGP
jgi:hypothetical protein